MPLFTDYQDDADYEFNARSDYVREAYAGTQLDAYYEMFCDYTTEALARGEEPMSFAKWRAGFQDANVRASIPPRAPFCGDDDLEIAF